MSGSGGGLQGAGVDVVVALAELAGEALEAGGAEAAGGLDDLELDVVVVGEGDRDVVVADLDDPGGHDARGVGDLADDLADALGAAHPLPAVHEAGDDLADAEDGQAVLGHGWLQRTRR